MQAQTIEIAHQRNLIGQARLKQDLHRRELVQQRKTEVADMKHHFFTQTEELMRLSKRR
jgi:hypothetical protein